MFKEPAYCVCDGACCQAIETNGEIVFISRENGRMIRRYLPPSGGQYGARTVGYGDAYFEFPFATVSVLGEEMIYDPIQK